LLQDGDGQVMETHSVSAGLDYPGVGPEHSNLKEAGRVTYVSTGDEEAVAAFEELSAAEGIIPALEPAHALAYARTLCSTLATKKVVIVNLSGRGDKDLETVSGYRKQK
jgi:tryptophan synthase beta chain